MLQNISMDTVKTYDKIDARDRKASFAISKMEDIYAKRGGAKDDPHRHDYFTVLVVKKGKGLHKIDFNAYELGDLQVYFVAPGQVHQVIEEQASVGFVMTFSTQFLVENAIQLSFIESLNLFHDYGQSPPLKPSAELFDKLAFFATEIFQLFHSSAQMKTLSIGAYLKLFLIECNNICSITPDNFSYGNNENKTVLEFKELVNECYKTQHSTSYYADALHITPDHLNRIIKSTIGKTAKEYIQSRIITEAKRLIYFSQLTNKEIGYELGFSEPANFSAFFKKCTGFAPSNFVQTVNAD